MSDEVTVTETALVLQEIDESDVLVKESVLAYLMLAQWVCPKLGISRRTRV